MYGITNVSNAPSIVLKNTTVSSWTSGSYNGFSYRGSVPITGVTADMIAEVTFSQSQAESGNYSSVCTTYDGGLYIYAKVNTNITIPSIIIHSIVESYYGAADMNPPTSGKTTAISSGAVYTALNTLTNGSSGNIQWYRYGHVVMVEVRGVSVTAGWSDHEVGSGFPAPVGASGTGVNHNFYVTSSRGGQGCLIYVRADGKILVNSDVNTTVYGSSVYLTV